MSKEMFDALQEGYDRMSIAELGACIKELKGQLEELGAEKSSIQKIYDFLTITVVPERMDDEGLEVIKIKDVGRLQLASDIRCACPAGNREDLYKWLTDHGHAAMITDTVNASTLKAFVKEQMKQADGEYPKDLLKIDPYSRATVVKG